MGAMFSEVTELFPSLVQQQIRAKYLNNNTNNTDRL